LTPAEYAIARPSTKVRENVARSLFQMCLAPLRLSWRILPHTHPARIYANGRVAQSEAAMDEALDNDGFRATSWAVKLSMTLGLFGFGTIADLLNLNPISNLLGL
jgi:hypothetical protein